MVTKKSVRKLVRDNIPEMIRQGGIEPDVFVATDEELTLRSQELKTV